ncbi:MAG TPA: hypothetical protein DCQ77_07995 [Betaproteobacteria bacterium]|nr:hypothetical protein [Betaproteobacteria bacterium]
MTTTINNATAVEKNPHFAHGNGIEGLCHNLQAYPQEWAGAIFTNAYNPQRLDAIASQASNVKMQALMGVRTVGAMLAVAAQSGELENINAMRAGFLVQFLGDVAEFMDTLEAHAQHDRDHGSLVNAELNCNPMD